MPPLVAAAAISAAGAFGGAAMSSHAAGSAARRQTESANHAADVEAASAREALDFQKSEAARAAAQAEADRHANYDQWAAGMNAHNAARARYGYGTTAIPGYVPGNVPPAAPSPGAALMGRGGPVGGPPGMTGGGFAGGINPPGRAPLASNQNAGINPNSVGSMLMPPPPMRSAQEIADTGITMLPGSTIYGRTGAVWQGPDVQLRALGTTPARPAPRSIGASLYGGR